MRLILFLLLFAIESIATQYIPGVIQESAVEQGCGNMKKVRGTFCSAEQVSEQRTGPEGSSDFLAGGGVPEDASSLGCQTRDIAKGKDRSEDEKYEAKATRFNRLLNHERYTLSICAIFQNEAPYLKEWIEYHKLLGVEHFYLYNDRSQDNYLAVLAPYISSGQIELFDCIPLNGERHFFNQRRAYVRGLNAAKGISKWVAFIDLDEFIVPKRDNSIPELLLRYEDRLGIMIQWQKFGTSGYWEIPQDALMIELLTKASPIEDEDNFVTKSIVQLDLLPASFFDEDYVVANAIDLVHFCQYASYDGVKARKIGPISHQGKDQLTLAKEEAQINHYWCRTEKYYLEQKVDRKARLQNEDFGKPYPWPEEKIINYLNLYNFRTDESILRFVPQLKNQLTEIVR